MIAAFSSFGIFSSIMKPKTIMQVFETTDIELLKTSIYCKGIIKEKAAGEGMGVIRPNIDFFADTADKMINHFSILEQTIETDKNESDSYMQYRVHGQTAEKELFAITIWSEKKYSGQEADIYISLELLHDNIYSDIENKKQLMQKVMEPFAQGLRTSLSVTGTYSGQIDGQKFEQVAKKNALTASIRYSRYEDKTYITLTSDIN
jgi:hypothetical protein